MDRRVPLVALLQRAWTPLPYALLTLAFGSVGPLLYLIRRVRAGEAPVGSVAEFARG